MAARDLNSEYQDLPDRKYAYEFDYVLRRFMMRTLEPHFVGCRALELGCYEGEFTKLILDRFSSVTVVEGSIDLLERARRNVNGKAKFIHSSFEHANVDGYFDAIFLIHTIEHLDDPIGILKRIRGWLSESGRLFVVAPNANAPSRQIAVGMGLIANNAAVTEGEKAHGHRFTYSLDTLEAAVRDSGIRVVSRGGIMFKPLANFQLDKAMHAGIIDESFFEGCYRLGMLYPDLCASVYLVGTR